MRIWRNNGDGTLANSIIFLTGRGPTGIAVADFTGDGKPDIATSNYSNSFSLLRHNGQTGAAAGYLAPVNFTTPAQEPDRVVAVDVNGDGILDLAVGGYHSATNDHLISIFINGGTGNFSAPVNYQPAPGGFFSNYGLAFNDLDNDGDADLISGGRYDVGSSSFGAITIRRNNGSGAFGNVEIYQFPGNSVPSPKEITTGDLNGDGFADIIAALPSGRTSEGYGVLLSNGAGGFQTPKNYEASQQPYDVAVFDNEKRSDKRK